MDWIDVTRTIDEDTAPYAPEEAFTRTRLATVDQDGYAVTRVALSVHLGTHMDAPAHFLKEGATVERAPLDLLTGEALVMTAGESFDPEAVPMGTKRLLLKTDHFPGLTANQARTLIARGVRLIGIDRMSVAPHDNEMEIHALLLGGGAWIVENLSLEAVADGPVEWVGLPLKIAGAEGAPVRALVRRIHAQ